MKQLRIAITGPEATGKTELAEQLAHHYKADWVPEYAREYLTKLIRPYGFDDLNTIAQQQFTMMRQAVEKSNGLVFFDTEMLVMKVWSDVKFGRCHKTIQRNLESQPVDFYLLPDIDLPWESDPLREHPHLRPYLKSLYLEELQTRKLAYHIVSGIGTARLYNAIAKVDELLSQT